jgi:hypothetical protein
VLELQRDIKLDLIAGKYKAISAYKIPKDIDMWLVCPNCNLKPLVWEFNNGRSHYDSNKLRDNWNHWVNTGEELESREQLLKEGKW